MMKRLLETSCMKLDWRIIYFTNNNLDNRAAVDDGDDEIIIVDERIDTINDNRESFRFFS